MRDPGVATAAAATLAMSTLVRATLQVVGIGATEVVGRFTILDQDENYSARVMASGVIILVGLSHARLWSLLTLRTVIWPVVASIAVAIVQTGSRGGLLALIAGLIWLLFAGKTIRRKVTNGFVAIVAISGLVWVAYQSETMRQRWISTIERGEIAQRERLFPILFVEKPIAGWGIRASMTEAGRRMPRWPPISAHNLPLDVLASTGLVGAIPLAFALWMCVRFAWAARDGPSGALPMAMLISMLVGNLSGNRLQSKLFWFVVTYALACGSQFVARRKAPSAGLRVPHRLRRVLSAHPVDHGSPAYGRRFVVPVTSLGETDKRVY